MVMVRKKRRVVVDDDEPEQAESSNGRIIIARTISRADVPKGRMVGPRNPEVEKLVRRLIRLEPKKEAAVIQVTSKAEKIRIREATRKPLRVRGYDLTAVTNYDDELGEVLILFATKREVEEPEEEEEDVVAEVDEDEEEEEEEVPVRRKKKKVRV